MRKKLIFIYAFFLLAISLFIVSAHQPKVGFNTGTLEDPIIVESPEISKAYYGELEGSPEYYKISSDEEFLLYLSILAPDIESARTDFIGEVTKEGMIEFFLEREEWGEFYEPFGGDNYLEGPEFEEIVSPGVYIVKVSNPDNLGKYSLAIGKIESFPLSEIINTFFALPKIKKDFFGKSPLTAYFNLSGLFLLFLIVVLVSAIFFVRYLIKKYGKDKKRKQLTVS